jgi:hypothetical protein|tara:strand:+ start:1626 stop:1946 length:321 start_codon:yes stop_codon:yes gene_type:complete
MAAGDAFVDMQLNATTGGTDLIPAAGVTAMITFMACDGPSVELYGMTTAASASAYKIFMSNNDGGSTVEMSQWRMQNMKLIINNAQAIKFVGVTTTRNVSYSGVEI